MIDLATKVKDQTPHIINRETHGERDVPGWMQVFPERGRILIHQLPTRQQIVIDVSRAVDRRALLEVSTIMCPELVEGRAKQEAGGVGYADGAASSNSGWCGEGRRTC